MADNLNTTTASEIPEASALLNGARASLDDAIEKLIAFRDLMDPDPDLEEEPDREPNMGWTEREARLGKYGKVQGDDLEPSLGSVGSYTFLGSQDRWAFGTTDEREDEHDGSEPDVDGEPELGSVNRVDQTWWAIGGTGSFEGEEPSLGWTDMEARYGRYSQTDELEQECEDEGAQCEDEGSDNENGYDVSAEQYGVGKGLTRFPFPA